MIRIWVLNQGFVADRTLLKTEHSYAAETRERLHEVLDEILDDEQKEKKK